MNTLRAHGTTAHVLTKNTAGQCQPLGSHNHMTVENATEQGPKLTFFGRRQLATEIFFAVAIWKNVVAKKCQ